jgi:hypothetical protein
MMTSNTSKLRLGNSKDSCNLSALQGMSLKSKLKKPNNRKSVLKICSKTVCLEMAKK